MYALLLFLHFIIRWLVLTSLLIAVVAAFRGWLAKKPFTKRDNAIRHWTATIAHLQLVIGLILYAISPLINYFMHHFQQAVHLREVRFFGMEHSVMMLAAIIMISIGSVKTKRKQDDTGKFKTMAIWYTLALLVILMMIPFPFSPMVGRPYWRAA